MKKQWPAWVVLTLIAVVSGVLLGVTNELTAQQIHQQALAAAEQARVEVLPDAERFVPLDLPEGAEIYEAYQGMAGDHVIGYTAQMSLMGYSDEIEVTVGIGADGRITGVNVGGEKFKETMGLGSRVRQAAFTDQFIGLANPAAIGENIDAVTSATISSRAVVNAVNHILEELDALAQ